MRSTSEISLSDTLPGDSSGGLATLPGGLWRISTIWPKVPLGASLGPPTPARTAGLEAGWEAGIIPADCGPGSRGPGPGAAWRPRLLVFRQGRDRFLRSGLWAQMGIWFSPILWHISSLLSRMALLNILCSTAPLNLSSGFRRKEAPRGASNTLI